MPDLHVAAKKHFRIDQRDALRAAVQCSAEAEGDCTA